MRLRLFARSRHQSVYFVSASDLSFRSASSDNFIVFSWTQDMTLIVRNQALATYRSHQVLHNYVTEITRTLLGFLHSISVCIQIFSLFIAIAYRTKADPIFVVVAAGTGFLAFVVHMAIFQTSSRLGLQSQNVVNSFLQNGRCLADVERKAWRASRSMRVQFAQFHISHETFINTTNDVVVSRVLDLLVMSRSRWWKGQLPQQRGSGSQHFFMSRSIKRIAKLGNGNRRWEGRILIIKHEWIESV
jgi:hypothetical protein